MTAWKRFKGMALATFVGRGLNAVRQLMSVPLLLGAWGAPYYGEWLLISIIPSFLAMSNLGLGAATATQICFDIRRDKSAEAWSLMKSTTAMLGIGLLTLFAVLLLLVSTTTVVGDFFREIEYASIIILALAASTSFKMLAIPFNGWWFGRGKPFIANHWDNGGLALDVLAVLYVACSGCSALCFSVLSLLQAAIWFCGYALITILEVRKTVNIVEKAPLPWLRTIGLLKTGIGYQLCPLWQAILFQGSIALAAASLGAAGAALWGAMRIMVRSGHQLIEILRLSLNPEFQIAYAERDWFRLSKLHALGIVGSLLLTSCSVVILLLIGRPAFHLWTDHKFSVDLSAWAILVAGLIPLSTWWVSSEMQVAMNKPWFVNVTGTALSLACLYVMWMLSGMGITGLCIGIFLFDTLMAFFVVKKSLALIRSSFGNSLSTGIRLVGEQISRWRANKLSKAT